MKAVEYFIKESLEGSSVEDILEFVHFGCTSEDINNLCHAMMLRDAMEEIMIPTILMLIMTLKNLAMEHKEVSMLSRTHGQSASPTTMGKEFVVFIARLERQLALLLNQDYFGKFNGAVGNYNAHLSAYPDWDWIGIGSGFIEHLGLTPNLHTTQIENHDYMAELFDAVRRLNTILMDLDKDLWSYISRGFFKQKLKDGEVGSSTMPHKVNPIDFENAEGNIGLANAILDHLASKLTISRMQRDLSDSTAQRNIGTAFAQSEIAIQSLLKGLSKIEISKENLKQDLMDNWEILAEPIQTILRRENIPNAYENLKDLTRGQKLNEEKLHQFIDSLDVTESVKDEMKALTPESYTGIAESLAKKI